MKVVQSLWFGLDGGMLRHYTEAIAKLLSYINLSGESFTYEKNCQSAYDLMRDYRILPLLITPTYKPQTPLVTGLPTCKPNRTAPDRPGYNALSNLFWFEFVLL